MRAKEAVSHMSKPTTSGGSTNKEQTPSSVQTVYLRTNSNSQHIITQAQTVCISFHSLTDPVCHYGNGILEPGHSTSPWIPSHPTPKNLIIICLSGRTSSKFILGKGNSFQPTCTELPLITDVSKALTGNSRPWLIAPHFVQQLPEGASNAVKTTIPVLAEKPGKDSPRLGAGSFLTQQHTNLLACGN